MRSNYSKLIAVVPTYNERSTIGILVKAFFDILPTASMLVVDDNSPDKTTEVVANLKKEFPRLDFLLRRKNRGFGRSYIDAFKKLAKDDRYETIAMIDADFSHDPREIPKMLKILSRYKVAIGSRYAKGGVAKNWGKRRVILSRCANFYARCILGVPLKDLTAGFFVFDKSILTSIDLDSFKSDGVAFLLELKYKIFKAGYKIYEHPAIISDRVQGQGESKISRESVLEALLLPWKLRF